MVVIDEKTEKRTAHQPFDPFAGPAILATAPSTEPQREIWTAARMGEDASLAFNESVTLRMLGPLDLDALLRSHAELLARHEALRTTFSGDGLTLCVSGPSDPDLPVWDWSSVAASEREMRWSEVIAREVETPFDLERGPLFRARFAVFGPEEHLVVLTAHHIVCDGWSTAVLVRDWAALYNARRAGKSADLPPADAFSAYAREQVQTAQAPERAADEDYWLKQFTGEIPVLELPTDRPRPPLKTYRSRRFDGVLPAELVRDLKKTGAKSKASLFVTLLAGFKVLVSRLSGQEDVIVGIPAAGQSVGGHDGLVGHCVNMLPLRSKLAQDLPFIEHLSAVRTTMLDAYDHQQYTFGTLLKKLPLLRDASRLPLISVIFNVDRGMTSEAIGFEGIDVRLSANARHFENFDIFLNVVELEGRAELECQYNADLFDDATIGRWIAGYELLLQAAVMDPGTEIGRLPIVGDGERRVIDRWNETALPFPVDLCVHELIERQAEKTPDAVACEFEQKGISYREINERANRLARKLQSVGAKKGALVGLCLDRSIDMLVGLVAILKAGAAYVPLDPGYPLERLSFMVEDSQMPVLVTDSKTRAELPLAAGHIVCVDTEAESLGREDSSNLPKDDRSATPESVAYVIYTSGSTGKPKGVLVPHRAVVNLLTSVQKTPGMTQEDVVLAITTLSFDIAVSEVILPLTVGAKIVLVSREVASDGARLLDVIKSSGVTFIDATPATYRLLLAAGWSGASNLKVICTGEAMPRDLAVELGPRAGEVWNGYGPTETTVWSTFYRVPAKIERILIGRPVGNTQIHILDSRLTPMPIGVPGEIYIAGAGVSHGYLNRPDLTKDRFVNDPFAAKPGALMYRTGDLARYLPTGEIECLGRNDNQVKLRGYRIELGEIEDALGQHPDVRQVAVIVREDRPGDARLVAYAVCHPGKTASDADLRAHLKKRLPDYMVPAAYVDLKVMPLTPSGKIDRKALPVPDASALVSQAEFVAPRTANETLLAELWKAALNVPRVSVHDDFFALGGHSLLASQILARLRRDHGIELSFRKLFEAPTIALLAELLDQQDPNRPKSEQDSIVRRTDAGPAPLSISQERLWLLEEMDPSQRLVHSLPAAWELTGAVDVSLMQRCLNEIARRHETLRTTIQIRNGEPVQVVAPDAELPIREVDLSDRPADQRLPDMHRMITEWTNDPFELAKGPLLRCWLIRLEAQRHVFFTLRHNIIWDGWSFDIFLREMAAIYDAFSRGAEPSLPSLPVSYGDYVVWQRKWVQGPELARQAAWWRDQLAGDPPDLKLPTDRPRPTKTQHGGANEPLLLPRELCDRLTAIAHSANATLFTVLFGAFNVMLHRYTGQDEILVGTPVRARNRSELEDLIGPFINAVILRTKLAGEPTFTELLTRIRDTTLDAFSHEDMPLELLGSRPPLVRAFFSLQDARTRPPNLGTAGVSQMHVEPPAASNDIMLWMMERQSDLFAMMNYSTELFEATTIRRLLRGFATLLESIAKDPRQRLSELPVVAPEDAELEKAWSEPSVEVVTAGEPAEDGSVQRQFELQAKKRPDARALVVAGRTMSYRELDEEAAGVHRELARLDLGPSPVVAVAASGSDFLAAALAVLKLGGAFVALDPAHPLTRNQAILAQLKPKALIRNDQTVDLDSQVPRVVRLASIDRSANREGHAIAALSNAPAGEAVAWISCRFDGAGRPLTTSVPHASLLRGATALASQWGIGAEAKVLTTSPFAELGVLETLLPLVVGGCAILVHNDDVSGAELAAVLETNAVDCMMAPAFVWGRLFEEGWKGRTELVSVVNGEPSSDLCERLITSTRAVFRMHAYLEPSLVPFAHRIEQPAFARRIGRPVVPTRLAILDGKGARVPLGALGELHLRDERAPDTALVRTGDAARFADGGSVEVRGRSDRRVELLGHRFDLGEIGAALEGHPGVESAVAVLHEPQPGDARLVAYFVGRRGVSYTETELRRELRKALPEHMVPQTFLEIDALPMSDAGKIDYARLPLPYAGRGDEYVAPSTPSQRMLAEIWAEALKVPRVSVYDNFFDLGGHSLLCFKVIGDVEKRTGKRLSPRAMLLSSLEQLAADLSGATPAAGPVLPAEVPEAKDDAPRGNRLFQKLKGIIRGS